MRPKIWDGRECDQCGLQIHEADARFCRRCGDRLGLSESAGTLYVRREANVLSSRDTSRDTLRDTTENTRKKQKPVGSRSLPFRPAGQPPPVMAVGRLGMDITNSTLAQFKKGQATWQVGPKATATGSSSIGRVKKTKPPSSKLDWERDQTEPDQ